MGTDNVLDWHRRENKAAWWEYFRLSALSSEELLDEHSTISGLGFVQSVGGTAKAPVHRYTFPIQETDLRGGEDLRSCGGAAQRRYHSTNAPSILEAPVQIPNILMRFC